MTLTEYIKKNSRVSCISLPQLLKDSDYAYGLYNCKEHWFVTRKHKKDCLQPCINIDDALSFISYDLEEVYEDWKGTKTDKSWLEIEKLDIDNFKKYKKIFEKIGIEFNDYVKNKFKKQKREF